MTEVYALTKHVLAANHVAGYSMAGLKVLTQVAERRHLI